MRFELQLFDPHIQDLAEGVERTLQSLGQIKLIDRTARRALPVVDAILTVLGSKGHSVRYVCEAKHFLTPNSLRPITERLKQDAAAMKARPLLIAPHVGDSIGEQLRSNDIAYLDTAGNGFLKDSFLYIWLRGFKPPKKPERITRAFQASGLRLVALLLSHPNAIESPYRRLADDAGIALGSVSRIIADLRSLGFVRLASRGKNALVNRRKLLEHWEFGYATRLRPQLNPQTYRQAEDLPVERLAERIPPNMREEVLVGGELAAAIATQHLRPQSATFQIRPHRPLLPIVKEMKLIPDRNGNIILIEQFGAMSAWTWQREFSARLVHPLLIYGELLHGKSDSRLAETAQVILEQFLAPTLDDASANSR